MPNCDITQEQNHSSFYCCSWEFT